ncbi:MAG: nucleotidyl transferase AbiEii/AbiGii toxin family protein [Lachnospiraceae bacterium]|nr:nucleotidyl transferase AbiEii/AbiGii toxin family protein [Lachnospiraceae bacterium]
MKTPEQLKGAIRNIAKRNKLMPQEVLQMFLFERILERLSVSRYRENFILKGGLLISSMIGITERTTMDMDTTVCGISMEKDVITNIMKEIVAIDVGDEMIFEVVKMEPIREDDEYNNFRVHLKTVYGKMNNHMKIDITTGDKVTPAAIEYSYKMMFEDKQVPVMAYTLETILAEKYETIIRRNIGTTRARDFYDLYVLFRSRRDEIRKDILKMAVTYTSAKRGSLEVISEFVEICEELRNEEALHRLWNNYAKENSYAIHLKYEDMVDNVLEVGKYIEE